MGPTETIWGPTGTILGPTGTILGPTWANWGPTEAIVGPTGIILLLLKQFKTVKVKCGMDGWMGYTSDRYYNYSTACSAKDYDNHVDIVQDNVLLDVVGLIWESVDDDDVDIVEDNVL